MFGLAELSAIGQLLPVHIPQRLVRQWCLLLSYHKSVFKRRTERAGQTEVGLPIRGKARPRVTLLALGFGLGQVGPSARLNAA